MVTNPRDKYKTIPIRYIGVTINDFIHDDARFIRTKGGLKEAKELYSKVFGIDITDVAIHAASDNRYASIAKKYPEISDGSKLKQKKRGKQ